MSTLYRVYGARESGRSTQSEGHGLGMADEPELDYAVALREAQLALKARYPHPYYWAPFVYVGRA
jgi:hypothetical protein